VQGNECALAWLRRRPGAGPVGPPGTPDTHPRDEGRVADVRRDAGQYRRGRAEDGRRGQALSAGKAAEKPLTPDPVPRIVQTSYLIRAISDEPGKRCSSQPVVAHGAVPAENAADAPV